MDDFGGIPPWQNGKLRMNFVVMLGIFSAMAKLRRVRTSLHSKTAGRDDWGPYHGMGYSYEYGGFHKWWYPNSWMVHSGKSENEMDDWGVANFRKPPYSRISWLKSSIRCFESSGFHKSAPAIVSGGLWRSHTFRMLGQAGQQTILCLVISDL